MKINDFFSFKRKKYNNKSSNIKYIFIHDIKVAIPVNFESTDFLEENLEEYILKIKKIKNRHYLLHNMVSILKYNYGLCLYFRLSDVEGDNEYECDPPIPNDLKNEIISDVRKSFNQKVIVDDFPDRGYIVFDITIQLIR